MNSEVDPLLPSPSLLSLPYEIVNNCVARIPKSYYPKISLVSKTVRSLILSNELRLARFHLKTREKVLYVCLKFPGSFPSWFSLWIKPDQILTNDIDKKKKHMSTGNTLLVPIPSSYSFCVPLLQVCVGSDIYAISQCHTPSSVLLVRNKEIHLWHQAPNMTIARVNSIACVLDGKIYVMGGCATNESTYWVEVFDTKTQTWEPLPNPGAKLRLSKLKTIKAFNRMLYVKSSLGKDYHYYPKVGKWYVKKNLLADCMIDNVWYLCGTHNFLWYDTTLKRSGEVRCLDMLIENSRRRFIEIVDYDGKLLILWDENSCQQKEIWCAVITLKRYFSVDEVWGYIEWANVVRTVSSSYVFLRSLYNLV